MSRVHRRTWLQQAGMALFGLSASRWLPVLADQLAQNPRRRRQCILLWMTGGPSQIDTFDMKPGHAHGGEFAEIATNVPGVRISEHLPQLATMADKLAIVRSLSTREGDHSRATYLMRTGYPPQSGARYPTAGASLSKELATDANLSVNYVSIAPYRAINFAAFGPGFLGPRYAPLTDGAADHPPSMVVAQEDYARLTVEDLQAPDLIGREQYAKRIELWRSLQDRFLANHRGPSPKAHDAIFRRALQVMDSQVTKAFRLEEEPDDIRKKYGTGRFGQGCLMARRLIESGVAFVEVALGSFESPSIGWDTHENNFETVRSLSRELDAGWATLMRELDERGLLESTTILWIGEFGRTPRINERAGRDHFPAAWTCVFGGGGIRGGQTYGETSDDGTEVHDGLVNQGDLLATLCAALGVPPDRENVSEKGRPIRLAEGRPIAPILDWMT
ncbi:MAG: DUF1501 domain-containing protein [Pirellulaceae bacterium]